MNGKSFRQRWCDVSFIPDETY